MSWFHTFGWNGPRTIHPQREKAKKRTAPQRMNLPSSGNASASVRVRACEIYRDALLVICICMCMYVCVCMCMYVDLSEVVEVPKDDCSLE